MLKTKFQVAPGLQDFFSLMEILVLERYQNIEGDLGSARAHIAAVKSEADDYRAGFDNHQPGSKLPFHLTLTIENQPYNTHDLDVIVAEAACKWIKGKYAGNRNYSVTVAIIDNTRDRDKITLVVEHEFVPPEKM